VRNQLEQVVADTRSKWRHIPEDGVLNIEMDLEMNMVV
jgi:hypothetical protein